jgi:orotidine-5'-phosphate decarboxylase
VVAGATYPEDARRLRALLPNSLFLVPGYGAQGAPVEATLSSFVRRDGPLEGGMVSSSRGILFGSGDAASTADWLASFTTRLDAARDELSAGVV